MTTSSLSSGTHTVSAAYQGDANFQASTAALVVTVNCAGETITGGHNGSIIVTGIACIANAQVNGAIVVRPGGILQVANSTVTGALTANDHPATIEVCEATSAAPRTYPAARD